MLDIRTTGRRTVTVAVRGDLDLDHASALRAAVTALLNRGDVTAIDLDIAAGVGVTLRLTAVSPPTAKLLHLLGADDLLPAALPAGSAAMAG